MSAAPVDIDGIEARAKEATRGEWFVRDLQDPYIPGRWAIAARDPDPDMAAAGFSELVMMASVYPGEEGKIFATEADRAHIAGLSPDVALELCAEVRRLRKLAEAERALRLAEVGAVLDMVRETCPIDGFLALDPACQDARVALSALGGEP